MKTTKLSNQRLTIMHVTLFTMLSTAIPTRGEPMAFVSDQASPWSNWDI